MTSNEPSLDYVVLGCHKCGSKNAVKPPEAGATIAVGQYRCRRCQEPLDPGESAQSAARLIARRRQEFLSGDQLAGQRLGEFELQQVLGRGAMGVVYRAHDTLLERDVAIKVFPPALTGQEEHLFQRVLNEARVAAKLLHPGVVQVFRVGEMGGYRFIVMEFVDGRTLSDILRESGPLDVLTACQLFAQVLATLIEADKLHIVHRDIKPGNLLVTSSGTVKVSDFGLSTLAGPEGATARGEIVGTPRYASPEVLMGEAATHRSDMYSLAVVMYRTLSGRLPFEGNTRSDMLKLHQSAAAVDLGKLVPQVPAELADLVHRCLSRLPEHRPTAPEALALLTDPSLLAKVTPTDPTAARSGSYGLTRSQSTLGLRGSSAFPGLGASGVPSSGGLSQPSSGGLSQPASGSDTSIPAMFATDGPMALASSQGRLNSSQSTLRAIHPAELSRSSAWNEPSESGRSLHPTGDAATPSRGIDRSGETPGLGSGQVTGSTTAGRSSSRPRTGTQATRRRQPARAWLVGVLLVVPTLLLIGVTVTVLLLLGQRQSQPGGADDRRTSVDGASASDKGTDPMAAATPSIELMLDGASASLADGATVSLPTDRLLSVEPTLRYRLTDDAPFSTVVEGVIVLYADGQKQWQIQGLFAPDTEYSLGRLPRQFYVVGSSTSGLNGVRLDRDTPYELSLRLGTERGSETYRVSFRTQP